MRPKSFWAHGQIISFWKIVLIGEEEKYEKEFINNIIQYIINDSDMFYKWNRSKSGDIGRWTIWISDI